MARIQLVLDRLESYCLLVAQEYLRQMISGVDPLLGDSPDDEGIPLIVSIRPLASSSAATSVVFGVESAKDDFVLKVMVNSGDLWPKQGIIDLMVSGLMESETGVLRQEFKLRGNPANPQVVFTQMRGGG